MKKSILFNANNKVILNLNEKTILESNTENNKATHLYFLKMHSRHLNMQDPQLELHFKTYYESKKKCSRFLHPKRGFTL